MMMEEDTPPAMAPVAHVEPPPVVEKVVAPPPAASQTQEDVDDLARKLKKMEQKKMEQSKKAAKKDALLARVRAAQERAKQAQLKQLEKLKTFEAEEDILKKEQEKKNDVDGDDVSSFNVDQSPLDLEDRLESQFNDDNESNYLPAYLQPPPMPPPEEHVLPPPPPMMEPVRHHHHHHELPSAPPLFDVNVLPPPMAPAPMEAPRMHDTNIMSDLPPPSYQDYEQEEVSTMESNPNESQRILNEQALIFEQLAKEKADNDAAIAAAATEDFVMEDEEEKKEETAPAPPATRTRRTTTAATETSTATTASPTIQIGNNTRVQLRGEEVTMSAIARGEAMIVQCMACQNWMQIANTARLMFCPVCSTVSRAEKQSHMTLADAQQAMAERRREERQQKRDEVRNMTWGQYVKSFFAAKEQEEFPGQRSQQRQQEDSQRQTASLYENDTTTERASSTASSTQQHQPLIQVQTGEERTNREIPAARVAERKPLHSCVTNLGKLLTRGGSERRDDQNYDEFMQIDGVDSSSLLTVTRAGRQS